MYKTKTEHTLNKHPDAVDKIIYINADKTTTEVTLEAFLGADERHTEEQFKQLKKVSDEFFRLEDKAARERSRYELQLFDWSDGAISKSKWTGSFLSETVEEECFGDGEDEAHELYLARKEQAVALLPEALKVLTKIQMRRLVAALLGHVSDIPLIALLLAILLTALATGGAYYFISKKKGATNHEEIHNDAADDSDDDGSVRNSRDSG